MTRTFGRDHRHIHGRRRNHLLEVNIEAVREHQRLAGAQAGSNRLLIHLFLSLIRNQDHDEVSQFRGILHAADREAGCLGPLCGRAAGITCDHDVHAAIAQIKRMSMSLASIPYNCHPFSLQQRGISVLLVIDIGHCCSLQSFIYEVAVKEASSSPRRRRQRIALQCDSPGSHHVIDPVRAHNLEESIDLSGIASNLEDIALRSRSDNPSPKDLRFGQKRSPLFMNSPYPYQQQLTLDAILIRQVDSVTTSISLFTCFRICWARLCWQRTTMVMRERDGSELPATVKLSILYPRALNSPATRDSTPNLFSTSTDSVRVPCSCSPETVIRFATFRYRPLAPAGRGRRKSSVSRWQ